MQEGGADEAHPQVEIKLRHGVVTAAIAYPQGDELLEQDVQITNAQILCQLLSYTPEQMIHLVLTENVSAMKQNYPNQDDKVSDVYRLAAVHST